MKPVLLPNQTVVLGQFIVGHPICPTEVESRFEDTLLTSVVPEWAMVNAPRATVSVALVSSFGDDASLFNVVMAFATLTEATLCKLTFC